MCQILSPGSSEFKRLSLNFEKSFNEELIIIHSPSLTLSYPPLPSLSSEAGPLSLPPLLLEDPPDPAVPPTPDVDLLLECSFSYLQASQDPPPGPDLLPNGEDDEEFLSPLIGPEEEEEEEVGGRGETKGGDELGLLRCCAPGWRQGCQIGPAFPAQSGNTDLTMHAAAINSGSQ